jgi:hypothetical protein
MKKQLCFEWLRREEISVTYHMVRSDVPPDSRGRRQKRMTYLERESKFYVRTRLSTTLQNALYLTLPVQHCRTTHSAMLYFAECVVPGIILTDILCTAYFSNA